MINLLLRRNKRILNFKFLTYFIVNLINLFIRLKFKVKFFTYSFDNNSFLNGTSLKINLNN